MSCPNKCNPNSRVDICPDGVIGTALADILAAIKENKVSLDAIITVLQSQLAQLVAVNANTDTVEAQLQALIALAIAGNVNTSQISTTLTAAILPELQAINASTAEIKLELAAIAATLTTIATTLAAILAEQDKELLLTTPVQVCIDGVNYLTRERVVYDSETALAVSSVVEYSADSVAWTATAPVGAIILGACANTTPPVIPNRDLKIFYEEIKAGGALSIADIVAATGAAGLLSIQVVAVGESEAKLSGDTGTILLDQYVPLWSHSAQTGSDYQDQFTNSNWAVSVGTGSVRVSAVYFL